jgi:hypothetical protein
MEIRNRINRNTGLALAALALCAGATAAYAQPPLPPPPELDRLVQRIALYPDPLLSQVLAAATFSNQIPEAARWADQHHYLTGDALAAAINGDQLPWDPSVQALLPFPSVLEMMARDPSWTARLGDAFLASQGEVMDAVQRMRHAAYDYGYLRSNGQVIVRSGPYIEIGLADPGYVIVPYYDPLIVFARPRPGFVVGGAVRFGFGISLGASFRPWGWGGGYNRFDWGGHALFINNRSWGRTYVNRETYVHPYEVRRFQPADRRPAESHAVHERSDREREAARTGRGRVEEHRGGR